MSTTSYDGTTRPPSLVATVQPLMDRDNVIPFIPRETSEDDAVNLASTIAGADRLPIARAAVAWVANFADGRRAVLRFALRLVELHMMTVGPDAIGTTEPLLHDASKCPPNSRLIRARAVLRALSEGNEIRPQAPRLALTYVSRLLELELDDVSGGP